MSDAPAAVAQAHSPEQRVGAGKLVGKQEIEAELERRRGDVVSLDALPSSDEVAALRKEVVARIDALTAELATVDGELAAARTELAKLKKLAAGAPAAA